MSVMLQTRHGSPEPAHEEPSLVARLPEIAFWVGWKYRWRLAPVYLALAAAIGVLTGFGVGTATILGFGACTAEAAARAGWTVGDRKLMSARERRLAAIGLGGAAAWALVASQMPFVPPLVTASLLPAALAWPAYGWITGRQPAPPPPSLYSPFATAVLEGWMGEIYVGDGPRAMRGSMPIEGTVREPAEGALVMDVQLAKNVHAKNVATSANSLAVEALYNLPEGTVRIDTIRESSTQIRVTLTPSRHLEVKGGLDWEGPILHDDGIMPIAVTADGSEIGIPLYGEDGVRHGMITGTSGAGKSVTSVAVLTPGVKAGCEIPLYVDGKRGTSAPYLRPLVGKYARLPQQWMILIEMAHAIMIDRQERRGALGLHEWNTPIEQDPIITLFLDEATAINRMISGKHVHWIEEMLEHGRAVGVRVIQASQDPGAEFLIGGVHARGLMTGNGWAICHRAGGSSAGRLTLDSTNVDVPLKGLPNGQAAITNAGQLVGYPAQVKHATKDRVLEEIEAIHPRQLAGADLKAVGADAWNAPHWDDCWQVGYVFDGSHAALPAGVVSLNKGAVAPAEDDLPASRVWVLDQLVANPAGMTLNQLQVLADEQRKVAAAAGTATDAPARRTISNALSDLVTKRSVAKNGAVWTAVASELSDDIEETA